MISLAACPTGEERTSGDVGVGTYRDCTGITSLIIDKSTKMIDEYAFKGCVGITKVRIEGGRSGVTNIHSTAFEGCSKITSLYIDSNYCAENFKTIFPFEQITSVTLGDLVYPPEHGKLDISFENCYNLSSIDIGCNMETLDNKMFSNCVNLCNVNFGDASGIETIGDYAFSECISLETITLPKKTKFVGIYAFSGCSKLKSVTVLGTLESIGDSAFAGCVSLASFTYKGKKSPTIDKDKKAFADCTNLKVVEVTKLYEGDMFLELPIHVEGTKTDDEKHFGDWLLENIEWIATGFTVIAAGIGILLRWDEIRDKIKSICCKKKDNESSSNAYFDSYNDPYRPYA